MPTDSLTSKSHGSRISASNLMGLVLSRVLYVRNISFYLSYTSTTVLTFFITHIEQRRGCILFPVDDESK